MFEHRTKPLLPPSRFAWRMLFFLLMGGVVDGATVALGAAVFHDTEGVSWMDAFVDAAMVVTGNGPQGRIVTSAGKVFLTVYALVGGVTYIIVAAMILAPALHRLLHVLHLRAPEEQ